MICGSSLSVSSLEELVGEIRDETARTLNTQLELLAKIQGQIKDVTINIINTPVWIQLQQIILEATKDKPEVRKKIADALNTIAESSRSS